MTTIPPMEKCSYRAPYHPARGKGLLMGLWLLLGVLACRLASGADVRLVDDYTFAQALVPSFGNGGLFLGSGWKDPQDPFNIGSWQAGGTGVGFQTDGLVEPAIQPYLGINVGAMKGINATVLVRIPFTMDFSTFFLHQYQQLTLRMRFSDGFVAYLNGVQVAGANAPESLDLNSSATATRRANQAVDFEDFDLTPFLGQLAFGRNILAIQGLNDAIDDGSLLVFPELIASEDAPPVWPDLTLVEVASLGTSSHPTVVTSARDDSDRLFIGEQAGRIRSLKAGTNTTFLDIRSRVLSPDVGGIGAQAAQGLLGLAFPFGFPTNAFAYVTYTRTNDGALILARYALVKTNNTQADPSSEQVILRIAQPFANNPGGAIEFGPDGYLYLALGDGGSAGDPGNRSQNPTNFLGKILRLDVEKGLGAGRFYSVPTNNPFVGTNGVAPEIWALGLRHPSRLSFDRFTGDLWIGEVGQDLFDEVNLQPAGTGGLNYLWKQLEGNHNYSPGTATPFGVGTPPLLEHPRGETDLALVGGAVCGAGTYPRLTGKYLYGDLNSGTIYLVARNGDHWSKRAYPGLVGSVGAIGMDDGGDLYLANYRSGRIYRVTDPGMISEFRLTREIPEPGTSLFKLRFPIDPGVAYQLETFDSGRWSPVGSLLTRPLGGDPLMEYSEAIPPGRVRATRVFRVRRFGVRLPGQP